MPAGAEQAAAVGTVALPPSRRPWRCVAVTDRPAVAAARAGAGRLVRLRPDAGLSGGRGSEDADHRTDRAATRCRARGDGGRGSSAGTCAAAVPSTCSPSWPRWRWSGSGWRTCTSPAPTELARAAGHDRRSAACWRSRLFWRVRVRLLGVLGWAAYGAAVLLLVGVLAVGRIRERGHPVDRDRSRQLPALRAGQARAAARPRRRPRLGPAGVAALHAGRAAGRRADRAHPGPAGPQHHDAARRPRRIDARHRAGARSGSCCRWSPAAAVSAPLLIGLLRPYQVERLGSFLVGAHESPTGSGWAVRQAHIAVGSGTLFGRTDDPLRGSARAVPARAGDRPGAGQPGRAVGTGRRGRCGARRDHPRVAAGAGQPAPPAPRTARSSAAGWRSCMGVETVVSVGGNLGLLPLAGVPFPLLSYGGTALVVHLAAIGVVLAVRRDGARRRLWAPAAAAQPAAAARPADRARASRRCWSPSGSTAGGCRAPQGEALLARRAGADDALRPAARPARLDHRPARRAARGERRGRRRGVDRVLVVPAPAARAGPRTSTASRTLTGRPARRPRTPARRCRRTPRCRSRSPTCPAAPATRSPRPGSPACSWSRSRAGPTRPARCSARCSASSGWPRPRTRSAGRTCRSGEVVGRAGLEQQYDAVLRGINGRQCLYVDPRGVPVALGERQDPVPGADLRLSIDLGLQRQLDASLAAAVRAQPRPRGPDRCRRRDGPEVGPGPRHREHAVVRQQHLRAARRRRARCRPLAAAPGSPMLEHVTQAVAPPGSTFKLVVAAANQAHPVFAPQPGHPDRGRLHLRRPHLRQLEADGPDEPGAVDRHVQRRLLLQAGRRARGRTR